MLEPIRRVRPDLCGLEPTQQLLLPPTPRRLPSIWFRLPKLAAGTTFPALPIPEDNLRRDPNVDHTSLHSSRVNYSNIAKTTTEALDFHKSLHSTLTSRTRRAGWDGR